MVHFASLIACLAIVGQTIAVPVEASIADFELELVNNGTHLVRRQDYNQNYQTSGNVNFQARSNGYSVTYSNAQDFVVGKGWRTGSTRNINFSGTFQPQSGTSLLAVYGWTTNPLVEYYMYEDYTSFPGGTYKGSFTTDGGTYNIYQHTQVNQPSIVGTTTFEQYISVRQQKRSSGTVSTSSHFNAWAQLGMRLGQHNYQVLATEAWGSAAGSCSMTISG
ncbi:putative endo-1,4-beta-xylanase 1 precursor [Stachybotrys elegans]|uniref:Endo-1,4-beta-xylanase n=1 Tax=Stachybotrys elegans TaxID=80388 RepID=A0A8K0WTR1_9HYPO|nr:putative endo-1,4-beta-xylanase 1 precursor [Stachybotrys elegans]